MVAKTTRRRSVALEMVPVGVNPSGPGADGLDMSWLPCDVGVDGVTSLSFRMRRLAPPAKDDIRFEIRRKSEGAPMTTIEQADRSEEHTSELQSLMRISYAVFCLKKKKRKNHI